MNDPHAQAPARQVRRGVAVVLLALLAPPGTLVLLAMVPTLDLVLRSAVGHLVVVSAISACALAVAVAAAAAAGRSRDGSLVLLGLGCLGIGFLMLAQGLVTPGIGGRPGNLWVGRLPVLAIAAFAVCLAAGGLGLTAVLVAISLWPAAGLGSRPVPGEAGIRLALVLGAALVLVALGGVHWRRWRLGLDSMQLALVVACLLSAGALLSLEVGRPWHLAWWDYHAFLLAGFAAAVYTVVTGHRRSSTLHDVLEGVFANDPMAHISRGYSETLRALIAAVEARDAYTHGHSARVAELSVSIGLRPSALRTLAEGAYLHDVGKVGIPDHVPNKPGALTDEERAWIQEHPVVGADIVGRAPSLRDALTVIRQHHERYDGRGYPDGLAGEEISLAARIVAVADVGRADLGSRLPAGLAARPCPGPPGGRPRRPFRPALP
jgi:hypothetical protein